MFQYRAQPTRNFCRQREVELECLGDPDRAAYDAVGLERGGLRELAPPKIGIAAIRAAREGALAGDAQGGDRRLMPATFVVGTDGRVLFAHYHRDQSDNPPMEPVLDAVRRGAPSGGS